MSHASPEDTGVHEFTRLWWGRLPQFIRDADHTQAPHPFPLLRFLNGVGGQAGAVRDSVQGMWSGEQLTPNGAPDGLLRWLAYLMGLSGTRMELPISHLRQILAEQVAGDVHGVGSRAHVAASVRPLLAPGARVQVLASSSDPHTLIICVNPQDVPGNDPDALQRRIRAAGVVLD